MTGRQQRTISLPVVDHANGGAARAALGSRAGDRASPQGSSIPYGRWLHGPLRARSWRQSKSWDASDTAASVRSADTNAWHQRERMRPNQGGHTRTRNSEILSSALLSVVEMGRVELLARLLTSSHIVSGVRIHAGRSLLSSQAISRYLPWLASALASIGISRSPVEHHHDSLNSLHGLLDRAAPDADRAHCAIQPPRSITCSLASS